MIHKFTPIRYYIVNKENFDGIYIFHTDENYAEGDLHLKKNCSVPLVWIIRFDDLQKVKKYIPNDVELVISIHIKQFQKANREVITKLSETIDAGHIQLMIRKVEEFINETITAKY